MPGTILCHAVPTGQTLAASLFPDGSDTAAATGVAATEATNRKTTYSFSTNLTGLHLIHLLDGSSRRVWVGWAVLAASGTVEASDDRKSAQLTFTVSNQVDANALSGGGGTPPTVAAIRQEMDANSARLAAIDAKTTNLPSDPADESLIIAATNAIIAAIAALNNLSQANVRTAIGMASNNLDSQLLAIKTESDAIYAAIDTEILAIKAKTDQLAFTNAGKVDASLQAAADIVAAVCNKLADHVRRRTQANVEASAFGDSLALASLYGAVQQLQKSGPMVGGSLPVFQTDDTLLGTLVFTSDLAAEPVTGVS